MGTPCALYRQSRWLALLVYLPKNQCYEEILDSARKEKAGLLLEQRILHTADVAERLGYHNFSSFHRAFKRWYGKTPAEYCLMNK